jgi:hypothetical protein
MPLNRSPTPDIQRHRQPKHCLASKTSVPAGRTCSTRPSRWRTWKCRPVSASDKLMDFDRMRSLGACSRRDVFNRCHCCYADTFFLLHEFSTADAVLWQHSRVICKQEGQGLDHAMPSPHAANATAVLHLTSSAANACENAHTNSNNQTSAPKPYHCRQAHLVDALEEAVLLLVQHEHHVARLHGGVAAPRLPPQHDLGPVLQPLRKVTTGAQHKMMC